MRFPTPLVPAVLIRRYKRFLADIRLQDGREVTAHCPNPGSMIGLAEPGARIWVEPNQNPARKLGYGWRLNELENGHFVGIDTAAANRVVRAALAAEELPELAGYEKHRPEVRFGQRSRVDFLLQQADRPDAYVEVKSVTLVRRCGLAEFPDSVSARATRHLDELAAVAKTGCRAVLLYLVQRTDCVGVGVAADLDPDYANAVARARRKGVEVVVHDVEITPDAIGIGKALPVYRDPACGEFARHPERSGE